MKKLYILVFSLFIFLQGFAQSNFELSFEAIKDGSNLKIEYFIEKTSGADFTLGASNLPLIKLNDNNLNWSQIQLNPAFPSPFTNQGNPANYSSALLSAQNFVNLTILPQTNGIGTGVLISNSRTKIASLLVPITGQCAETELMWETQWGALNNYRNDGHAATIKANANFVNLSSNTILLFDLPTKPSVTLLDSTSACEGSSVGLMTSSTPFDLSWMRDGVEIGVNDTLLMASTSGLYQAQLENCSVAELSDPIQVTILPAPEQATITENNGTLYSSVSDNIQWYRNGQALMNQNAATLIPTSTGIYTVKTTNSCGEATSDPYNFSILSVENENLRLDLKAFPNPYIGSTNIVVTLKESTELRVEVYDLKGTLVSVIKEGFFEGGVYEMTFSAQNRGWSAGTYILKVRSGDKEITQNLVELK